MCIDKNWSKFIQSGKVDDYLSYVNSCKEKEIVDGNGNLFYNTRLGNKGIECGGK